MIVIPTGQSLTITNDGGTAIFDFSDDAWRLQGTLSMMGANDD